MAYLERHVLNVTTDTGGEATVQTPALANGFVRAIRYVASTADALGSTGTATITAAVSGLQILSKAIGAASADIYPQAAVTGTTGSTTPTDMTPVPVANEKVKLEIANAGSGKVGVFHVYVGG